MKVRGYLVAFHRKIIDVIYGMLDLENDGYRALMGGNVDYNEFFTLCEPGDT